MNIVKRIFYSDRALDITRGIVIGLLIAAMIINLKKNN